MYKISADKIYFGNGHSATDVVLVYDKKGLIVDITNADIHDNNTVKHYKGYITPGFVNTHCHLELSHMIGKADTGTGLIPFISQVVKYRDIHQETIIDAIVREDKAMWDNGIMAVGDISNKVDTARTKKNSKIQYYTFVEMFDFINLALTENTISQYKSVFDGFEIKKGDKKSFVPHAPYTVSKELFKFIEKRSKDSDTISIHNQETPHENQLFLDGTGDFPKFFESIGMSFDYFTPTNTRSINYALENMSKKPKTLFVHNTTCNTDDIEHAIKWNGDKVYWATCPNANLYIENSLPNYKIFLENKAKMTIGTDSLTSNWQLSIAEEIKTIMKYCSYVSFDDLIVWACKNGAEALGFEDRLGTIAKGKQPGLVHWLLENNNIQNSAITRII